MTTTSGVDPGVLSDADVAGRVVRGGALRAVGFAGVNLLGVASSVVLLRYLGVADFGRYGTVVALVAIASGLAEAGLNITGSRELALVPAGEERRRLLGALLGVRLVLLTAAVLAALAFAELAGYDRTMVAGTALAGAGAVLIGVQSTLTLPLVVELRNGLLSLNEVLKQVILVVGVVLLAVTGAALTAFFAVQVAVGVGALLAVPLLVHRRNLAWPSLSREALKRLALIALPVAVASVLTALYVRMLIVIASLLTTEYETGLLVTSARIVEMVGGLAMLLMGVILPVATVAARDDRARLHYVLAHTTKVALLGGGLLALVIVVAARPIVVLLGGEQFAPAAGVLRLQAPVVLTLFLVYVWTGFLIADGRRRALVYSMLIGTSAVLVVGTALVAEFEAKGAAVAAVTADAVLVAVILRAVRRVGDGAVGVPAAYMARYAAALIVAGAAAFAIAAVASAIAAAAVAAALFVALALALRLVPSEFASLLPGR